MLFVQQQKHCPLLLYGLSKKTRAKGQCQKLAWSCTREKQKENAGTFRVLARQTKRNAWTEYKEMLTEGRRASRPLTRRSAVQSYSACALGRNV